MFIGLGSQPIRQEAQLSPALALYPALSYDILRICVYLVLLA